MSGGIKINGFIGTGNETVTGRRRQFRNFFVGEIILRFSSDLGKSVGSHYLPCASREFRNGVSVGLMDLIREV